MRIVSSRTRTSSCGRCTRMRPRAVRSTKTSRRKRSAASCAGTTRCRGTTRLRPGGICPNASRKAPRVSRWRTPCGPASSRCGMRRTWPGRLQKSGTRSRCCSVCLQPFCVVACTSATSGGARRTPSCRPVGTTGSRSSATSGRRQRSTSRSSSNSIRRTSSSRSATQVRCRDRAWASAAAPTTSVRRLPGAGRSSAWHAGTGCAVGEICGRPLHVWPWAGTPQTAGRIACTSPM
mmetsp:Transcript_82442/g.209566  ORF Transcript_82442/g.209566 Transcript_82442/m.209566 type:complete len:235 (-) Transcript_82442:11-715(-)